MSADPPLELSRLRDIGWSKWDPIGLLPVEDAWEKHPEFADEYDKYLLHVASRLRRDWSISDAADYLVFVEGEYMGLGATPACSTRERAEKTASAIKAYLDGLAE